MSDCRCFYVAMIQKDEQRSAGVTRTKVSMPKWSSEFIAGTFVSRSGIHTSEQLPEGAHLWANLPLLPMIDCLDQTRASVVRNFESNNFGQIGQLARESHGTTRYHSFSIWILRWLSHFQQIRFNLPFHINANATTAYTFVCEITTAYTT